MNNSIKEFKNKFPGATTVSTVRNKVVVLDDGNAIVGYGWTYFNISAGNPYNCDMYTNEHEPLPNGNYTLYNTDVNELVIVPLKVQ